LFLISKAFNIIIFAISFFFYTCFLAFSFILLIFSSFIIIYSAFTAFLAFTLALFSACVAFLISIRILFNFLNASFLATRAYASRILAVEKYISYI